MADNHGNTRAGWGAVAVATWGFVVAGSGRMAYSWLTFWVGAALEPVALRPAGRSLPQIPGRVVVAALLA